MPDGRISTPNINSRALPRLELTLFSAGLLGWLSEAKAQTGMGVGGGSGDVLQGILMLAGLMIFSSLVLIGFWNGFMAAFPSMTSPKEHRRVLRWVGLNWLEPSVTSFFALAVVIFTARANLSGGGIPASSWWFLLPVLSFLGLLLPPLFFSSVDSDAEAVWRALKRSALARVGMILLAAVGVAFNQAWLALGALIVGLGVLAWSFVYLMKTVEQLKPTEPGPSTGRTQTDAV
jgi:hypothetical protein